VEAFSTIYVRTHNSEYEIFLLDPESGRALVQGGRYFAETLEATVCGSTFGGCMLKRVGGARHNEADGPVGSAFEFSSADLPF